MPRPTHAQIVRCLLETHGRTFAAEGAIRIQRNTPAPLFQLLCLALLSSARISGDLALAAARAVTDAGLTTPAKLLDSTWEERTRILNRAGYARYDESTSRYLADTAALLVDRYGGDLRELRDAAVGDVGEIHARLTDFKGIGDVGAQMFLREVQTVWDDVEPYVDDKAASGASALGLPSAATRLRRLVADPGEFTELVAALVRTEMAGDHERIIEAAG